MWNVFWLQNTLWQCYFVQCKKFLKKGCRDRLFAGLIIPFWITRGGKLSVSTLTNSVSRKVWFLKQNLCFVFVLFFLKKELTHSLTYSTRMDFLCSVHPEAVWSTHTFTPINCPSVQPPCFPVEYFWLIWSTFSRLRLHYIVSLLQKSTSQNWLRSREMFIWKRTTTTLWRFIPKQTGITSNRHCTTHCTESSLHLCRRDSAGHSN